jgi:hypothetical protein
VSKDDRVERAFEGLAANTSRRGFLARVGAAVTTVTAGSLVAKAVEPADAERYYGFCGHTYTTHPCPHPTGLPRIDSRGFPMRASDGEPIDNLGRPVNGKGQPLGHDKKLLRDPDGRPLPPAPRTKICDETARRYGMKTWIDGSWYRCCNGHVRALKDCCSYNDKRINGDAALTGYCYAGRKVFCVMYFQTKVPC